MSFQGDKNILQIFSVPFFAVDVAVRGESWGGGGHLNRTTLKKIRYETTTTTKLDGTMDELLFLVGKEGEVWKGDNIDVVLPCLEMNELASEPRSLYPALKDKEGGERNKEGQKNKKGRVNKRCRSKCAIP